MTARPTALFDPEPLRGVERPTLIRPELAGPVVVLGSTQREDDLDLVALERDGIALRRRRGGGGAVLLHPEDLWLELWLPRGDRDAADLRGTACRVGEWWVAALSVFGIDGEVHRGGVDAPEQGAIACFAATGPGEVSVQGAKLVGISQWRARQGALVSSVLAVRPPAELSTYLSREAPGLRAAMHLPETAGGSGAAIVETLVGVIANSKPGLVTRT